MAVVGDLVVQIGMDHRAHSLGSQNVRKELAGINRSAGIVQRGSRKTARSLLELSRGAEDFAVSFGTGGLAGGLRGAGNNISQFATILGGPVLGTIAGVGVAAVSMWAGFNLGADKAKKKIKSVADELRETSKLIESSLKGVRLEEKVNIRGPGLVGKSDDEIMLQRFDRLGDIKKRTTEITGEFESLRRAAVKLTEPLGVTADLLDFSRPGSIKDSLGALGKGVEDLPGGSGQSIADIDKRSAKLRAERRLLAREEGNIRNAIPADPRGMIERREANAKKEAERLRKELDADIAGEKHYKKLKAGRAGNINLAELAGPYRPGIDPPKAPKSAGDRLASAATRGSAGAAAAINRFKAFGQSGGAKKALSQREKMLQKLDEISKNTQDTENADTVINSFSNVV